MSTWARKLGGFSDMPDAIKAVLEHLPSEPPSLPEFVNLCRDAGRRLSENTQKLEYKLTAEEKKRADEQAKKLSSVILDSKRDHKAWARKLKARHESGEILSLIQVNAYKEALAEESEEVAEALAA